VPKQMVLKNCVFMVILITAWPSGADAADPDG
jgi:hypothetical protein